MHDEPIISQAEDPKAITIDLEKAAGLELFPLFQAITNAINQGCTVEFERDEYGYDVKTTIRKMYGNNYRKWRSIVIAERAVAGYVINKALRDFQDTPTAPASPAS